jgi:hypothetical protein
MMVMHSWWLSSRKALEDAMNEEAAPEFRAAPDVCMRVCTISTRGALLPAWPANSCGKCRSRVLCTTLPLLRLRAPAHSNSCLSQAESWPEGRLHAGRQLDCAQGCPQSSQGRAERPSSEGGAGGMQRCQRCILPQPGACACVVFTPLGRMQVGSLQHI